MSASPEDPYVNDLIEEASPYLQQHAHNPVDWKPWSEAAFEQAEQEGKLVLISIGYSACHWCHVMEKECFEDEEVAALMNRHFVNIKVDREELPDVDHFYITAVQLMQQQAGWPLNCFALPDKRPIFGATYFPKDAWTDVLQQLTKVYQEEPEKVEEYASRLEEGIKQVDLVEAVEGEKRFDTKTLRQMVGAWSNRFDRKNGGTEGAPKFPLPNDKRFLLHYAKLMDDDDVRSYVELTLDRMADGGVHDQIGGGFCRYSTDVHWKVPHFEKMLYDNGQMASLYTEGWKALGKERYEEVVKELLSFVQREMMNEDAGFYSAIDADSEGEEGRFYVWDKEELQEVLGDRYALARDLFNINENGKWENDRFILLRDSSQEAKIAEEHGLDPEELEEERQRIQRTLFHARSDRERPTTDDKVITSWNAMMNMGFSDAFKAFGKEEHREIAVRNMEFLLKAMRDEEGNLYRVHKDGETSVPAYLDDHAQLLLALDKLYEITLHEKWVHQGKELLEQAIERFHDPESGMFFYSSDEHPQLASRTIEILDNVIPSSCSSMARALFYYGRRYGEQRWTDMADGMLQNVQDRMTQHPSAFSNWGILHLHRSHPFYELVVTGKEALDTVERFSSRYQPNCLIAGARKSANLPLVKDKTTENPLLLHVCEEGICHQPVESMEEALEGLKG